VERNPEIVSAINLHRGQVTHPAVAETFGLPYVPFTSESALAQN
jgi:alanine dehydrogenase